LLEISRIDGGSTDNMLRSDGNYFRPESICEAYMENTLTVEFRLFGKDLDIDTVSDVLGMECTSFQIGAEGRNTFWLLSTVVTERFSIHEAIHSVIDRLIPVREKLSSLIEQYNLRRDLVIELETRPRSAHEVLYNEHPVVEFFFDVEVMRFLSEIGSPIYIEHECEAET
jgi:hypothetical protein